MTLELVFLIIIVIAGVVASVAVTISFIKQPYQSKGDKAARHEESSQSLKVRREDALHRANEALLRLEKVAHENPQQEKELLSVLDALQHALKALQ